MSRKLNLDPLIQIIEDGLRCHKKELYYGQISSEIFGKINESILRR